MTPLRRKMIEEFQIRHYAPGTQKGYLHCVARFAQHFGRSPDQLGPEEVRAFMLHAPRAQRNASSPFRYNAI